MLVIERYCILARFTLTRLVLRVSHKVKVLYPIILRAQRLEVL